MDIDVQLIGSSDVEKISIKPATKLITNALNELIAEVYGKGNFPAPRKTIFVRQTYKVSQDIELSV